MYSRRRKVEKNEKIKRENKKAQNMRAITTQKAKRKYSK